MKRFRRHLTVSTLLLLAAAAALAGSEFESVYAAQALGRTESQGKAEATVIHYTALPRKKRDERRTSAPALSQLIHKYPDTFLVRGPAVKRAALTFDDVPDPRFTPHLLDVLKQQKVKATFFVVGSRARKHPAIVQRIVREGHIIGNHSYSHPRFGKMSVGPFRDQIERTETVLLRQIGYRPLLIRPPYGEITEDQLLWAKRRGYRIVNWNVDSSDWKSLPRRKVALNILSAAGRGSIILQHGGGGRGSDLNGSIDALPEVIASLRSRGYQLVTVPELLGLPKRK
ncbi:polysaccharide deacetylase family protein [Paenibacillus sp. CN-4]|uniref:polysaccharide deacetylase family protein n=1 Tax=Paenibacillus nanchangensis TaxID=3348343 RepID=UPI00397E3D3B